QLKPDGRYEAEALSQQQQAGLSLAERLLNPEGLEARIEVKPGGVAFHSRGLGAPEAELLTKKVKQLWQPVTGEYGLTLLEFDGGLEIRVPGRDKGFAVRTIL